MRVSIFSSAFTGYLASKLPCHPYYVTWTREHVIPKSIIGNRQITEDPRNILPFPKQLNHARSNLSYTSQWKDGRTFQACTKCPNPDFCRGTMNVGKAGVHPPDVFKGPIARSVLYSVGKYPRLANTIADQVLDLDTAILWDSYYPMSPAERDWLDSLKI